MKILLFDLETSPNLAYVWGLWQQNVSINQIESSTEVLCFGAQWLGQKKIHFASVHHDGKEAMLQKLHELMDEADVLVGWNSKKFDHKHINREFITNGLKPPSPTKDLDLMLVVKQNFNFPSNKLDYVAQTLGIGSKVTHTGFDLWRDCMAGDRKAWALMKKYQLQDVALLEDLYNILMPWMGNRHPNRPLYDGKEGCVACGSTHLQRRGTQTTNAAVYQRFRCMDCGSWMRSKTGTQVTEYRPLGQ